MMSAMHSLTRCFAWLALFELGCALATSSLEAQAPEARLGLACFARAYPDAVCKVDGQSLVFCSGQRFDYDDGRDKTHAQRLEQPDLEDTLAQRYPVFAEIRAPEVDFEPGRVRLTALLEALYGKTPGEVSAQLTHVRWMPQTSVTSVKVTRRHGMAEHLRAVSDALDRLPLGLRTLAAQLAGSLSFRNIAGTERVSAHAFGIALDVAPSLGDYFRWREPHAPVPQRYRNRMPREIVEAFEREGFIWGGRWHHYDTMHFEYRPELLQPECVDRAQSARAGRQNSAEHALPSDPGAADSGRDVFPSDESGDIALAAKSRSAGRGASPAANTSMAAAGGDVYAARASSGEAPFTARYAFPHAAQAGSLAQRFAPPAGFTRVTLAAESFGAWLRDLPLQPGRGEVRHFDGSLKPTQRLHAAVLDIDTGRRDLQQCADAVMRLRGEYLWSADRAQSVCFRAANGDAMPYAAFRQGKRPPPGRPAPWTPQAPADSSWQGFRTYLDRVFNFASTASLTRELRPVSDARAIEAGDVFIEPARGARYGHAVLVLDVADNARGERMFMIAQSYMPAQSVHVLINPRDPALSPWYRAPADGSLETPEWSFPRASLRRFSTSCSD